jgi:hypothetical protein
VVRTPSGGRQSLQCVLQSFHHLHCWRWKKTLFWVDPWLDGRCLDECAPDPTTAVKKHCCNRCTLVEALVNRAWIKDITGTLTIPAIVQYLHLRARVDGVQLQSGVSDKMVWKWTSSGTYLASSVYAAFFHGQIALLRAEEVWQTRAPREHKFFLWLMIQDRC